MGTPSEEELKELLEATNFTEKEIKGFYKFGPGNRIGQKDFLGLCAANGLVATVCTLSLSPSPSLSVPPSRARSLAQSHARAHTLTAYSGGCRGCPQGCGIYLTRMTTARAQTLK